MKPTTLLFAAALLFSALLPLAAQVPQIINCQGRISVSGAPFTGTGQFKFALVNATGSTTYWSHDGTSVAGSEPTGTVSLPVANGYYVAPLGDTGIAGMTAVPPSVFNNGDVRLRVWFNDGTKGMQLLSPDQRITSVGYAMMASTVPNGAITGGKLAEGTVNSSHLAIGAVQQQHIQPGAVQSFHLGANAITPDKVMANSINTSHLSGDAVNGEKWQPMSIAGAPSARRDHTAVWTGTRMLVWGGFDGATYLGDGALYHPTTNTWSPISATGAPGPRRYHSAVWTGTEMIVWGGYDGTVRLNDGGRYNPATDTWTPMAAGSLAARQQHTAVWTSTAMIVWGGYNGGSTSSTSSFPNSGEMYLPATDSWVAMATSPSGRRSHGAVWTGTGMIVHGGSFAQVVGNTGPPAFQPIFAEISASTGALFDPATNAWSPISSSGVNISGHCALWTGSRMLLWGSTSLSYDPVASTWGVPGGMVNAPT